MRPPTESEFTALVTRTKQDPHTPLKTPLMGRLFPYTFECAGVTLHLDLHQEDSWVQVDIDHDPLALQLVLGLVDRYGLECEDMCEDIINPDGSARSYLVEV